MNYRILIIIIASLNMSVLYFHSNICAQQKFLLKNEDMKEYKLIREINIFWAIGADSLSKNIIEQKWSMSQSDEYYIDYCEFDNEENAIKGIAYMANSSAMPFIFGSPTGEIIGSISWVSIDGSAVCFQKGTVGIKIFKPLNLKTEDRNSMLKIANKVLAKIKENVSPNVEIIERELLIRRLSDTDYQNVTGKSNLLLTQDGYTKYRTENTKWIINSDSIVMGYRTQWFKSQSIISIDVAEFSNDIDTQEALKYKSKVTVSPVCMLNDNQSISEAINEWLKKWSKLDTLKYMSIVGIIKNKSIHFYYYNNEGIDSKVAFEILESIN